MRQNIEIAQFENAQNFERLREIYEPVRIFCLRKKNHFFSVIQKKIFIKIVIFS